MWERKKHMMKKVAVEDQALLNGFIKTVQSPNHQIIVKQEIQSLSYLGTCKSHLKAVFSRNGSKNNPKFQLQIS